MLELKQYISYLIRTKSFSIGLNTNPYLSNYLILSNKIILLKRVYYRITITFTSKQQSLLWLVYIPRAVEILFLHTKECWNVIPVRNEEISPCNFSSPLKNHRILKEEKKDPSGNKCAFHQIKKHESISYPYSLPSRKKEGRRKEKWSRKN